MQLVFKQTLCNSDWKISLYIFLHLKNNIWHMHQQADTVRQSYSELCSICLKGEQRILFILCVLEDAKVS